MDLSREVKLTVAVPEKIHRKFKSLAIQKGITVTAMVNSLINSIVAHYEEEGEV